MFWSGLLLFGIQEADKVWIEVHENYQKRSWRNRYRILSSSGPETWSIPLVKGKNERQPIKEVRIAYDEAWITGHMQAIRSAYGKSPYFEELFPEVRAIFEKKHIFLNDFALESQLWALDKLSMATEKMEMTQAYYKTYDGIRDYRQTVHFSSDEEQVKYHQVWEERFGFMKDLSILDLLFCTGPEAVYYL